MVLSLHAPGNTHTWRSKGRRQQARESLETLQTHAHCLGPQQRCCFDSRYKDCPFQKWIQAESDTRGGVCQGNEREFLGMRRRQRQGQRGTGGDCFHFPVSYFLGGTLQARGRFGSSEVWILEYSIFIKDVFRLDGWIIHIGFSLIR